MTTYFFNLEERGRLFEMTFVPRGETSCRRVHVDPAELVVFEQLMLNDHRDHTTMHSGTPHYRLRTRGGEVWCFRLGNYDELRPLIEAAAAAERDVSSEIAARAAQQERLDGC